MCFSGLPETRAHRLHPGHLQPLPHDGHGHAVTLLLGPREQDVRLHDALLRQQRRRESTRVHRRFRDLRRQHARLVQAGVGQNSAAPGTFPDHRHPPADELRPGLEARRSWRQWQPCLPRGTLIVTFFSCHRSAIYVC